MKKNINAIDAAVTSKINKLRLEYKEKYGPYMPKRGDSSGHTLRGQIEALCWVKVCLIEGKSMILLNLKKRLDE